MSELWYKACLRCGGEMEEGFALDRAQNALVQGEWVKGLPEKSIWSGLKLKGRTKLPIDAYRCTTCGFLDLYARDKE